MYIKQLKHTNNAFSDNVKRCSNVQSYELHVEGALKVGFHYPSSRPEFTGRVHGPRTRVHFLTPVNSGRQLG